MQHRIATTPRASSSTISTPKRRSQTSRRLSDVSTSAGSSPERVTRQDTPKRHRSRTRGEEVSSHTIEQAIDDALALSDELSLSTERASHKPKEDRQERREAVMTRQQQGSTTTNPANKGLWLPFIIGLSVLLGAVVGSYLFVTEQPASLGRSAVRLDHALPLLTRHIRATYTLLGHAHELQLPDLDHVSVREMRDAAAYSDRAQLRADLNRLCEHLMEAKILSIDLGVAIWMAASATQKELQHVASALTSSSAPISARRVTLATEYAAADLASVRMSTARTLEMLLAAQKLGTNITQSDEWKSLVQAIGKTRRATWLQGRPEGEHGLQNSASKSTAAIARAGVLVRAVAQVQTQAVTMLETLQSVFTVDDDAHPPTSHGSTYLRKLTEELQTALADLTAAINRTDPHKA